METIQTLVKGLRQGHPLPQWTFRQLPGGSSNPLVKAGVLTPSSRSQKFVDCPDCDDCAFDEMPKWYSETDGSRSRQRLAFTCPRDMEVRDLPEDWIRIWEYDADRMAALISAAMGCEHHLPQHRDGHWSLGIAKDAIGKNKRELIVATRLDSLSDSVFGAIKDNGNILFVGHLGCDIPDDQAARRVFQFLDVLRFDAEGQLSVLHDVISSRFGGDGSSKPHRKGPAEKRIEEALFDYAKTMLNLTGQSFDEACKGLTPEWIATKTGVSSATISRVLETKKVKNLESAEFKRWNTAQIYYCICIQEWTFKYFRDIVRSYDRALQPSDAASVAKKFVARLLASRGNDSR